MLFHKVYYLVQKKFSDLTNYRELVFRYVCEAVSRRASMMASAGITALLKKMDYKDVVIAIDGSLFR